MSCWELSGWAGDPWGWPLTATHLWVANEAEGTLTILRAADGVNLGTVAAGFCPGAVAVAGEYLWVTNHEGQPGDQNPYKGR